MQLLFVTLLFLPILSHVYAGCICKNGGSTLCSCSPSYVRPQPKPKVLQTELKPSGDICSCGTVHVAPTPVKPSPCSATSGNSEINFISLDHSNIFKDKTSEVNVYKENKASKQFAADALSVHLALEQQERCNEKVPEGKLHYGHTGKVINGFKKEQFQDLNEGALYKLNGQRIALKKCKVKKTEEVEEESSEEAVDTPNPYQLSYADLGFDVANFPAHEFVRHQAVSNIYSGGSCKDHDDNVNNNQRIAVKSCSCQKSQSSSSNYHVYKTIQTL